MSPRIVDREARRGEILDAAIRAFVRNGYHATRSEDIAREAGVANGTVYLYFSGMDEIFAAAFERFDTQARGAVRAAVETEASATERLRSVIRAWLTQASAAPELSRLLLDFLTHGPASRGGGVDFAQVYAGYRAALGELVAEAIDDGEIRPDLAPESVASVLIGAIEGIVLQWIVDPAAMSPAAAADSLLSVLFEGVEARDG